MPVLALAIEELAVLIPIISIIGGVAIAMTAIVNANNRRIAQTREREQSRRELAAYVAEGTISPEDAAKLLEAGTKPDFPFPKPSMACRPPAPSHGIH